MSFWQRVFEILTVRVAASPKVFGALHIAMLLFIAAATAILCVKFKNADKPTVRKILLTIWLIMVVGEIYHQVCFAFSTSADGLVLDYPWYKFPFQFCSSPLYALPLAIFLKDGPGRQRFIAFLSSFSLFAGLAVILYPADLFVKMIGICIQTMIHHGLQVILGIFLAVRYRNSSTMRRFSSSIPIFAAFLGIALVMNLAAYQIITENGLDQSFNMFFISPYFKCTLPILSEVYSSLPYPAFLAVYFFGFILVAAVVYNLFHAMPLFADYLQRTGKIGKPRYLKR